MKKGEEEREGKDPYLYDTSNITAQLRDETFQFKLNTTHATQFSFDFKNMGMEAILPDVSFSIYDSLIHQ